MNYAKSHDPPGHLRGGPGCQHHFSVLLLTGTFDGKTDSGDAAPATSDTTSAAAGVNDPTADSFTAEATGDTAEPLPRSSLPKSSPLSLSPPRSRPRAHL